MLRNRQVKIPIWYHWNQTYYDILMDEMFNGNLIGYLFIDDRGIKYRKIPHGQGTLVDIIDTKGID